MADVQPNWAAFAHSTGVAELEPGPRTNARFMAFISQSWGTFTAETGTTKVGTPDWPERFSAWLTDRYPAPQEPTS